jgi:hypothetical protein
VLQGIRGGKDRNALIGVQVKQVFIAGDDEAEGRTQTHAAQRARRTLAGVQARTERETLLKLHQNAQRLLEPLAVVNLMPIG